MVAWHGCCAAHRRWLRALPRVALLAGLLLGASVVVAEPGRFMLSSGIDYSSGEYGGAETLSDVYVPLTLRYSRERLGLRVTLPYLRVEQPRFDVDGAQLPGADTASGLGDVILAATRYAVLGAADRGLVVDFTTKLKLATADDNAGLGTGQRDVSVQADLYKFLERTTVIASLGYRVRGEPEGVTYDDTFYAAFGASHRLTRALRLGLIVDYREPAIPTNPAIIEATAFMSRRLGDYAWIEFFLLAGASDASAKRGAGVSFTKAW